MYKFSKTKHIHTLKGKPLMGTTSVIREVLPPPLAWYGSKMALLPLGFTHPKEVDKEQGAFIASKELKKIQKFGPMEYYKLLQKCYRNHDTYKKEKGDYGTAVHATIEAIVKDAIKNDGKVGKIKIQSADEDLQKAVEQFLNWAKGKKFLYSEVHVYSEKLWLGGIIDLVYEEDGKVYLGDIKTAKDIYASNFIQLGMYDYQQAENGYFTPEGEKLGDPLDFHGYTIVNLPKGGEIKTRSYYAVEEMRKFAENLVELYRRKQKLEEYINGN